MAAQEQGVTPSVLDRLIDLDPNAGSDPFITRAQTIRNLKTSVRRDLEALLNTRRTPEPAGDELPEVRNSLYNYGLPDFTAMTIASTRDRGRLLRMIEETIRTFETRLDAVRVLPVETGVEEGTRRVDFQINALLKMDPAPERVSFDTVLQLTSGEYQVKGERG